MGVKRGGRPSKLTDEVERKIIGAVRSHQRVEVAAEICGIGRETLYGWLRTGDQAYLFVANGGDPATLTPHERRCLKFNEKVTAALAAAEAFAVDAILEAGSHPSEEVKWSKRCVGVVDGEPVYVEETTRTQRPPDWRAQAWYLERRVRGFQPRQKVEFAGPSEEFEFVRKLNEVEQMIRDAQAEMAAEAIEAIAANSEEIRRDEEVDR